MNAVVIPLLLLLGCGVTLYRGAAAAFVWIYLPVLILLSLVPPLPAPGIPDVTSPFAVVYGILAGAALRGFRNPGIHVNWIDGVMLLIPLSMVTTALLTEHFYTAVSVAGNRTMEWVAPYVLARMMFQSEKLRREALWIIVCSICVIAFVSLIEFRLWPYIWAKTLQPVGLVEDNGSLAVMAMRRWGFFRAQVSFVHPIDLGNCGLIMAALIAMLAATTPVGTRNIYVRLGMAAAIFCVFTSISFTSFVGLAAMAALFALLASMRWARALVAPMALAIIAGGVLLTAWLVNQPLPDHPGEGSALAGSVWVRTLIVQNSWKMMRGAGLFGYGKVVRQDDVGLSSVDNAYTLTTLWYGWVTLSLWLLLPVVITARARRAFGKAQIWRHVFPLATAVACVLGVMIAMYTVWFGNIYSTLFIITVGFTATLIDFYLKPGTTAATQTQVLETVVHADPHVRPAPAMAV